MRWTSRRQQRLHQLSLRPHRLSPLLLVTCSSFCSHVSSSHLRQISSSGESFRLSLVELIQLILRRLCRQLRTPSRANSLSTTPLLRPKLSSSHCEIPSEPVASLLLLSLRAKMAIYRAQNIELNFSCYPTELLPRSTGSRSCRRRFGHGFGSSFSRI